MKKDASGDKKLSFIIGGIVVMSVVTILLLGLIYSGWFDPESDNLPPLEQSNIPTMEEAIALGEEAVARHASYISRQQADIKFITREQIDERHQILRYQVTQTVDASEQIYHHTIELTDDRVTRHAQRVSDPDAVLSVSRPEPEEIISDENLSIRGSVSSNAREVSVQVLSQESGAGIAEEDFSVQDNVFAGEVEIESGQYLLKVRQSARSLTIPFILYNAEQTNL